MKLIRSIVNILMLLFFIISVLAIAAKPGLTKQTRRAWARKSCVSRMQAIAREAESMESTSKTTSLAMVAASAGVAEICQPSKPYSLIRTDNPVAKIDVHCPIHGHLSRADGEDKERGISNLSLMDRLEHHHISSIICFFLGLIFLALRAALPAPKDN